MVEKRENNGRKSLKLEMLPWKVTKYMQVLKTHKCIQNKINKNKAKQKYKKLTKTKIKIYST